jgi:hypothetical protein
MQSDLLKETNMKANESTVDRVLRVVLGVVLLVLKLAGVVSGALGWILLALGVVALVTGVVGFCPLYALLKIRTNKA